MSVCNAIDYNHPAGEQMPPDVYWIFADYSNTCLPPLTEAKIRAIVRFNAAHFCPVCITPTMHQQVNAFHAIGMAEMIHILHYLGHHLMVVSDLPNNQFQNWVS